MTPKQKKDFEDLNAVVKTLIGKVFELEDENREIKDYLERVIAHPALAIPPIAPPTKPTPAPEGVKGPEDAIP